MLRSVKKWLIAAPPQQWLAALVLLVTSYLLGYQAAQSDFGLILTAYTLAFVTYIWQVGKAREGQLLFWLLTALLLRLLLLGAFPALSDDIYRFIWDGRLWLAGRNPFDQLPVWYLTADHQVPGLSQELFDQLNSPEYHTIYPPVAQFCFTLACWLSPHSISGAAVVLKLILILADVGSVLLLLKLLTAWSLPRTRVLWYALNPLMIVEMVGNLHFEGVMIFFLLLGTWLLTQARWWTSAIAMALAVASKLLPLLFFPFLLRRLGWRRSVSYFAVVGGVTALLWWPLWSTSFMTNFGSSVNLYFRQFEFNASLFYLLKWLGYHWEGQNMIKVIGPRLAVLVFLVILLRTALDRAKSWSSLPGLWLFAIAVYLCCATTVHPWYTALPLVLCVFTPYRWPVLWSGLIVLSYFTYITPAFLENYWLVGLEYGLVVGYGSWEWRRLRAGELAG
jgi:alpha-1,6-mannosyltransferase